MKQIVEYTVRFFPDIFDRTIMKWLIVFLIEETHFLNIKNFL